MLQGSFYEVKSVEDGEHTQTRRLEIRRDHPIFEGHFPGLPVVPGVCMLQMVKEQLEGFLKRDLTLVSAANVKFLSLINPAETPAVDVTTTYSTGDDGTVHAEGSISSGSMSFFKVIKAVYR